MLYLRFVLAVQLLQYCLLSYIMAKGENYSKQYAFVLWMEDERVGVMPVSSVMKKYGASYVGAVVKMKWRVIKTLYKQKFSKYLVTSGMHIFLLM